MQTTLTFADVTALTGAAPGPFAADVHPEWTIGGKPNGGYLLAMLGAAAQQVGPHPHVLAISAHYVSSPDPGPVSIEVTALRAGRSASQFRVRLVQDGRDCVEALVTTGTLDPDAEPFWSGGVPDVEVAPREKCIRVPATNPAGVHVAIMDVVDLRIDKADLGFAVGRPSGRGELHGWLALPGDEAFTPASLLYAVDSFPPASFEIAPSGWVPTLELTVYVRALPAPGPVKVLQKVHLIEGQRMDESCWVWDSRDRLVAQSTQLAGIRVS